MDEPRSLARGRLRKLGRAARRAPAVAVIAGVTAWACFALWFDGPSSRAIAGSLAIALALATICVFVAVRPVRRALVVWAAVMGAVAIWWWSIPARNDRAWAPEVTNPAVATFSGDDVTVRNVRDFDYRSETDFTPRWEERTYRVSEITALDAFLSYWGPRNIAHTIMSWEFADGRHLAVSIETRKEIGESYSATRGFFRQYELYYVVADERDLIRLRTNHRGETVYLYRMRVRPQTAQQLFVDYLKRVTRLAENPEWYNAFTQNCTTTIRQHALDIDAARPWDWRLLVNGYVDELQYERGLVDGSLPFAELRERSEITARARAADADPDFARRIREGLPGFGAAAAPK